MTPRSVVGLADGRAWQRWLLYGAAVVAASVGASVLRPEGSTTSLWWPAAGVAVGGALLLPAPQRRWTSAVVGALTSTTNLLTGRPADLALGFGLVNAVELAVVLAVLSARTAVPRLDRLGDVGRFVVAVLVGSVLAGSGAALAVAALTDGAALPTMRGVTASHLSALLLLVPPVMPHGRHGDAGRIEQLLQACVLVTLVAVSFGPGQELPIAFLPLVGLVWAGVRLSGTSAVLQLLGVSLAVSSMTLAGWGPYPGASTADDQLVTVGLVQLFIIVVSLVTLPLVALAQERRAALQELSELALTDPLTGLPNRRLLFDRAAQAARVARHSAGGFTAVLIDLDNFKDVNDSAGHEHGDEVLQEIALRLVHAVRPGDTVARLGGDEFAVVCPELVSADAVQELVERVDRSVRLPVTTSAGVFQVGAAIGVAQGTGSSEPADVLREADHAMYAAKRGGIPLQQTRDS